MKNDLHINGTSIPEHEIEITTSRGGGPGGQHVQKTSTRITVRWNVKNTSALTDEQKARVLEKLGSKVTSDGDIIIHNSESRSQLHNKKMALAQLVRAINKGLHVPKKRMKTKISHQAKESRFAEKKHRGEIKKMRSKKFENE
jgi:ribosome-associated protein